MKKAKKILTFVRETTTGKKCAAALSASAILLTSVACSVPLSTTSQNSVGNIFADKGHKVIIELSENYLSPNAGSNISVLDFTGRSYGIEESSEIDIFAEASSEASGSESAEKNTDSAAEETTNEKETEAAKEKINYEKEVTTVSHNSVKETTTAAQTASSAPVNSADGEYTFSQLGISQMSDISVPDSIKFDENGVPLNYSYKLTGKGTAYNMGTTTATGTSVHPGVVAVNPNIIPYGSKLYIVAADGSGIVYGYSSAEDTGGFIYWNNAPLVDLYVNSYSDACYWGNRPVTVYVF